MQKPPAFQFYPKDWLSSPKVQLMSPEQEGAYIRLLCYCWDSGDCSLPDNDDELAILSRMGEGWFKGGSTVVRKCFVPHPQKPGCLTNERLLSEAEKQSAWREKSAQGGRQSAEKRRQSKGGLTIGQPAPSRVVEPNANTASSSSSANSSFATACAELTDFQKVYDAGVGLFPGLATKNTSAIHHWLNSGCNVQFDILPELERCKGREPRSWTYFTGGIMDARATREAPARAGIPRPRPPKPPRSNVRVLL